MNESAPTRKARKRPELGKFDDMPLYPESKKPETPRYLNIGAGRFYHPLWHNLDMPSEAYAHLQKHLDFPHDLMTGAPLPVQDNTLRAAYCSNVIEHLKDWHVAHLFLEVHRSLQAGGVFRVVCPDHALEYDAYARGDDAFFYWRHFPKKVLPKKVSLEQTFLSHFARAVSYNYPGKSPVKFTDEEVRQVFRTSSMEDFFEFFCSKISEDLQRQYPQFHCNWMTPAKVIRMLKEAGFSTVYESRLGQSRSPYMRNILLFDNSRPTSSLYVEAVK